MICVNLDVSCVLNKSCYLFFDKIVQLFALFSENFTQLTKILRDRRSQRSRQISTLITDLNCDDDDHFDDVGRVIMMMNVKSTLKSTLKFQSKYTP